jgi:Tfp pilus assembly protein PilX
MSKRDEMRSRCFNSSYERGTALVMALLTLALLMAIAMGISLTAISELGVSNTYATQVIAFQAAEAGLNHAASLTSNYTGADFTSLLALRGSINPDYLTGNNPFTSANAAYFASGAEMIDDNTGGNGHELKDASGSSIPGRPTYTVSLIDDEPVTSPLPPRVPNFTPAGTWEDGDPSKDTNNRVVVYSTGRYGNASVTLEGWIGFVPYPALVAQNDITVDGNAQIQGTYGGVHSNNNLNVGGSASIAQSATATGNFTLSNSATVGGFSGGGQPPLNIPKFVTTDPLTPGGTKTSPRIQDYIIQKADVILLDPYFADGADRNLAGNNAATVRVRNLADRLGIPSSYYSNFASAIDGNPGGNVDQTQPEAVGINRVGNAITFTRNTTNLAAYGWSYSNGKWSIPSNSTGASGHTFYIVGLDNYNPSNPSASTPNGGNVKITGNAGSLSSPIQATILATGSIEIAGNPYLTANLQQLQTPELPPFVKVNILMVAVEDIKITGDVGAGSGIIKFSGISYAGEQVYLSGNGEIHGQVIAQGNQNVPNSPVDQPFNEVTGSFTLDFNGGQAVGKIKLISWRQIKR